MDVFFVWLVSVVLGFWIFKKMKEWQNLPPGPWGLPVLGYLPFLDRYQPHLTLTELAKKFGPVYGISMGNVYTVVISDHKLIREAFSKESFAGRAPLYLTHGIMHGNGIICAEGNLWKDQRKLITAWLKSFGMSKHSVSRDKLEKRIADGAFELVENIQRNHNESLDLCHILTNCMGNVVNEIIFGYKFPPQDGTWKWLRHIQEEGCHEMGVAGIVNFLPFVRFISPDIQKTIKVLKRGQAQTHRLYASMVARRRKFLGIDTPQRAEHPPHGNIFKEHPEGHIKCFTYSKHAAKTEEHYFNPEILIPTDGDCILDSFLLEQKKRFDEDDEGCWYVRDEQLYYLLADMFGAGLDTTSVTVSWFLLYMALHQEEQDKLRDEILSVYPKEAELDSSRLPRLMAAVCETQRIRSVVPVGIPHGSLQETYLGNYKIPKRTMVIPLQWALNMDSDVWEDPEEFRPSRFLGDDGCLLKPQQFIPFQVGKRMCPGDELARMMVYGTVGRLLRRWRIKLASDPPTKEAMMGAVGLTLAPPKVLYRCEIMG